VGDEIRLSVAHCAGLRPPDQRHLRRTRPLLPITAEYDYSWMQWGDWVCKWGSATGWTCGGISNLDYNALGYGGFVEVHQPEGTNLSNPGDSGAPWYNNYYQEAWGIHSDSSNINPNDAFFMPVSSMRDWGHQVLTSP
jgi:hypothetical protein